jgi:hypothetical protein
MRRTEDPVTVPWNAVRFSTMTFPFLVHDPRPSTFGVARAAYVSQTRIVTLVIVTMPQQAL